MAGHSASGFSAGEKKLWFHQLQQDKLLNQPQIIILSLPCFTVTIKLFSINNFLIVES